MSHTSAMSHKSAMNAPLETRHLGIGYPGHPVGRDINLSLASGEVLCLLGPNGSGKSTLFKTLLGLLPAQTGSVVAAGQDIRRWSRRRLARHLGYVPQAGGGSFAFSVLEVVLMGRSARLGRFAAPSKRDQQLARDCLARLGISHLERRQLTAISGGERQLALIARALAQEPALLVMDEPTASLDFGNQIRVLDHLQRLRDEGLGILFCTHQPEHGLRLADRLVLFKQGRIRYCGSADRLTSGQLAELYDLSEAQVQTHLGTGSVFNVRHGDTTRRESLS